MAPFLVEGKYAIITGAGSGINLAFARLLLSRGCSVLVGDVSLTPEAEKLLAEHPHPPASADKPSAAFKKTDVTSWPQLSALFDAGLAAFPRVDIVCPGAGLFEPAWSSFWQPPRTATNPDTASRDPAGGWDAPGPHTYATLEVNLTHPIRLSQLAVGYWTRQHMPGCLVHVSSMSGHTAAVGTPLYFASKHGLHGFVRSLGGLRDAVGIRVGAVAPAPVRTPMWEKLGLGPAALTPEGVATCMLALCEDEAYGDGTILEIAAEGTRVVPLFGAGPPLQRDTTAVAGYLEAQDAMLEKLKTTGLST